MTIQLNDLPSLYTFQQLINKYGLLPAMKQVLTKIGVLQEDQDYFFHMLNDDFSSHELEALDAVSAYDIIDGYIDALVDFTPV